MDAKTITPMPYRPTKRQELALSPQMRFNATRAAAAQPPMMTPNGIGNERQNSGFPVQAWR